MSMLQQPAPTASIFRNRHVQAIIGSNLLLQLGIWIRNFAILLFVVDKTNEDPLYVSLISVVEFAPIFIFSFIGGTFADRWRPKLTMVWCDFLSAISVFIVLLTLIYGSWQSIFLATFVSAILSQFSQPSGLKLLKRHVPEHQLQQVMAIFQTLMAIFMIIGPMIGTYVYQTFGIYVSIGVMGTMFLLSALVLLMLPKDLVEKKTTENNFSREFKEGFRYVFRSKILRTLGGTFATAGIAVGLIQPLGVFVVIENLGMEKEFLQWLLVANGAAMLVGGGLVFGISKKVAPAKLLALGMFVSMISTVGIGLSTSIPLTLAFQVFNGLFFPCIQIGINTMILKNTEESFVGRVNGVLNPMFVGMMVIGMSTGGILMKAITLPYVYVASGLLFLVGTALLVPLFKIGGGSGQPNEEVSAKPASVTH